MNIIEIKKMALTSYVSQATSNNIEAAYKLLVGNVTITAESLLSEIEHRELDETMLDRIICVLSGEKYSESVDCSEASILAHMVYRKNKVTGKHEPVWTTNGRYNEWEDGNPDFIYALWSKHILGKEVKCVMAQIVENNKPINKVKERYQFIKSALINLAIGRPIVKAETVKDEKGEPVKNEKGETLKTYSIVGRKNVVTICSSIDRDAFKKEAEEWMTQHPTYRVEVENWLNEYPKSRKSKDGTENQTRRTRREILAEQADKHALMLRSKETVREEQDGTTDEGVTELPDTV